MTELEKLKARIETTDAAIASVKIAMSVDQTLTHDKHPNAGFTKALCELTSIRSQLKNLKLRMETVGR